MNLIYEHFSNGFDQALETRNGAERRVGVELKFPLVTAGGKAVSRETVAALWDYLQERGWQPTVDGMTGRVIGARKPGEQNDTAASCDTGFCTAEFSLAYVEDLFELARAIEALREELRPFSEMHDAHFLGYGIQPVSPPSKRLLFRSGRTSVWDKVFDADDDSRDGEGVHLFTVNAASHVHLDVSREEAIPAVNVLNGFSGAQIALTANSSVWQGDIDPHYKCVAEKLWDWWMPEEGRAGVPEKPFEDLRDYVRTVASFRPVFVKRDKKPIILDGYQTFQQYYRACPAHGVDADGREVPVIPHEGDIDTHSTCYWYDARLSRYYTVENRANDQQPPDDLMCVAALTLGLVSALPEALEALSSYDWDSLRAAREAACRSALAGTAGGIRLRELAGELVALARTGLRRRSLGEETFLEPLEARLSEGRCPADRAARLFEDGGIDALVAARRI